MDLRWQGLDQYGSRWRALHVGSAHEIVPDPVGRILWKYEPKQDPNVIPVMCRDTVNRGVSYGDGKIFLHQADTTLVALDAKTGKVVWSVKDGDPKVGETGTSAPFVIKDKVLVGVSGGEFGIQGRMTAFTRLSKTERCRECRLGSLVG